MFTKIIEKRRICAVICIFMLICLMFSGCGGSGSGSASSSDEDSAGGNEDAAADETEAEENEITFDGMTVVDNDECSIVITGINDDYSLDVELENKSSDITYMFAVSAAAVNGVETDPYFAAEVAAGKKSIEEIDFSWDSDLEDNGIDVFTDIELTFRVYDTDDWSADDVASETVNIYPYGEENASYFERESLDTDIVLADNDYVTVIVTGIEEDSIWGYTLNVFIVNKTDTEAMVSVDDASVNGYMCDPFWAVSVSAGKSAFSSIYWYDSELEEIGITDYSEIEEIEFLLRAYDYSDWSGDYWMEDTVTINP